MKRLVENMGFDFSCVLASKSSVLSFFFLVFWAVSFLELFFFSAVVSTKSRCVS